MDLPAVLYPFNPAEPSVRIDQKEFLIGRAKHASYDIVDLGISRNHCILRHNGTWSICDKSSAGTWLNGKRLKINNEVGLNDGDHLQLSEGSKYSYIFCSSIQHCPNSCQKRASNTRSGLDAEMAQRRRFFDYQASLQKDGLAKSILEKQQNRQKLEHQQKLLHDSYKEQLEVLVARNLQLQEDLVKKGSSSGSNLLEEKEQLQKRLTVEKQNLEELHLKETSDLAKKIAAFEAAESELRSQNKELHDQLERDKQQFEIRLEEERKALGAKFAEQLAEQRRLAAEKSEVEEALRLRIQDLEKVAANREEKEQQQRLVDQEKEEDRLSKEKIEFEKRLQELQRALEEKERQEKEKEKAFLERDLLLKAQEEERERERKEREEKMEAEFLAKKLELENLERQRQQELNKHKEEVTKELKDREAELQRKAEEHQRELEAQKLSEQERLKKEMEVMEIKLRLELESEVSKLQEEKALIETQIRGELSKKEGENAEILVKLRSELDQVKKDLDSTSSRRTLLEKELEEASRAKEAASKNEQQAKQDVIENFGELVESELQCSICNELFVMATTLNCNHTFCQECIASWVKKNKTCPICRAPYTQQSRSLVLDNFIDRMVENLSDDLKKRRREIVEERKVLAHVEDLEANPNKKRKTANVPVTVPFQIVNGNNSRILVPVTLANVPPGATVIRLPAGTRSATIDLTADAGDGPGGSNAGTAGNASNARPFLSAARAAAIAATAPTLGPPIVISSESDSSDSADEASETGPAPPPGRGPGGHRHGHRHPHARWGRR
ncbi:E3 ubiquitin-protein ligase RNF8-like isoform X2 [Thrips palmi]|uniref:E3 ubiquitin-protein ligase CHFR n=1 Tax=Thrips palmi TaxID=161013 RepID=A0A6P9AF02_THRPL|nr:E3 ubiquitin-protein ligase RNF8-like isoform X2 [Thrips palmi]